MTRPNFRCLLFTGFMILTLPTNTRANPGKPVAVRWWGQAMISLETYWNLKVVIDPYGGKIGYENPHVSGDLVLITHEHADHNNADLVAGAPVIERGLDKEGNVRAIHQLLDRLPGQPQPWWKDARLRISRSQHAIQVTSIPSWHDDTAGSQRGANAMFLIEVDGVRIVHCGDLGQLRLAEQQLAAMSTVDVLLIPVGGVYTVDGRQAADIVRQVKPRIVVPIHYKTPSLVYDLQGVQGFLAAMGDECEIVRAQGNTLAVGIAKRKAEKTRVVLLDFIPKTLTAEWEALLDAKDKASRASQEVFAKLSGAQMNFRPSNGTHTPRWNAEHMMGRELGFFSQIYEQLDSDIGHSNLNPKQMPDDYVAAHSDWTGAEEARQLERVRAFTRRFAYLLHGLELDEQAPGSHWTPRGLLKQMERHYDEHTANVKKKFELPDWPDE